MNCRCVTAIKELQDMIESVEFDATLALFCIVSGDTPVTAIKYIQSILRDIDGWDSYDDLRKQITSMLYDVEHDNKMLRERLEASKYLIEGLQDKLEVARGRVSDYDTVVSQRNFYFSECERLKGKSNENHK